LSRIPAVSSPAVDTSAAPGPRGSFLVGSTFEFKRDPLAFILKIAREYGDVATYQLANFHMYQVSHPDGLQRVLIDNNRNYIKGSYWDAVRQVGGNGLLASEGSLWLRQRRLIQPAFHRQRLAGFASVIIDFTLQMLEGWEQAARSGKPLDINQEFNNLTMRLITKFLFSKRLDSESHTVIDSIDRLLNEMYYRFEVPLYPKMEVPTLRNLRARKALRVVDDTVFSIIRSRQQGEGEPHDLLEMLMAARDEDTGEAMSEKQLRDEVITLLIAGQETTAMLLTWFFYLLSHESAWETRLVAENDNALHGRPPSFEDLHSLPILRMAIDETLRLYPSIWITTRTCLKDDIVCGKRIPAGAIVGLSPYVIHRLPAYWPDPEKFAPLRFSPENSADRPRFAYMPFGAGPRQCIGNNLALLESQLVLATILQRFHLEAIPGREVEFLPLITLHTKSGLWMEVSKR
jgi:cytochrome P450